MSKKKLAASILVVLLGIVLNVLVILYTISLPPKDIKLQVGWNANQASDIEIFYLNPKQKMPKDFNPNQSGKVRYQDINQDRILEYTIPSDTEYLRLDFGSVKSETRISTIVLSYEDKKVNLTQEQILEVIGKKQTKWENNSTGGIKVQALEGDPYIVYNTQDWGLTKMVEKSTISGLIMVGKIVLCIIIDMILLLFLRFSTRILSLPIELYHNRKLILKLSFNDFKTRFAGSYLGIIWAFIQPIVTVLVYWFVFEKGLKAGGMNTKAGIQVPFVLWLLGGLVPWFFFQDALSGGSNALIDYSYLVKKVVFKISVLPIVKVISAIFVHLFFIAFTVILYAAYKYYPDLYTLQIMYYSFSMMLFVLGLVYATSAIIVFFRDLSQIIQIVLQVGMWMTPIMWNIDTMDLSPVLINIFKLNPMYYIVSGYRDALISKVWFWEHPQSTLYFWIITVLLFGFGTVIFRRLKVHFADVL
ncbi:MAG: ABC transporter permease [Lachnospiraceae bacterium]